MARVRPCRRSAHVQMPENTPSSTLQEKLVEIFGDAKLAVINHSHSTIERSLFSAPLALPLRFALSFRFGSKRRKNQNEYCKDAPNAKRRADFLGPDWAVSLELIAT